MGKEKRGSGVTPPNLNPEYTPGIYNKQMPLCDVMFEIQ